MNWRLCYFLTVSQELPEKFVTAKKVKEQRVVSMDCKEGCVNKNLIYNFSIQDDSYNICNKGTVFLRYLYSFKQTIMSYCYKTFISIY